MIIQTKPRRRSITDEEDEKVETKELRCASRQRISRSAINGNDGAQFLKILSLPKYKSCKGEYDLEWKDG